MNLNVDLGQLIITGAITVIGFFIKREINTLSTRLDKHDTLLFSLVGDVQRLIGINTAHFHKRQSDDS